MTATILSENPIPGLPSASGIELIGPVAYVISDDAPFVYLLDAATLALLAKVKLFESAEFGTGRIPKSTKPDLEAMTALTWPNGQAGVLALHGIRKKGQVQAGQKILINGAGGGAGMFAIQLAKQHGAEVTAVDNSHKLDYLRSLGADHVIDYTRQDFTKNGNRYDLILDVIAHRSAFAYARALQPNGTYFFVGGSVATLFQILLLGPWIRKRTNKNVRLLMVPQDSKDLMEITELCLEGKVFPVIDRTYPLHETAEALRYVGQGRAKGKVVITI